MLLAIKHFSHGLKVLGAEMLIIICHVKTRVLSWYFWVLLQCSSKPHDRVTQVHEEPDVLQMLYIEIMQYLAMISYKRSFPNTRTVHLAYHFRIITARRCRWWEVIQALYRLQSLCAILVMTSSNGNIFRVTGPLCGEFTTLVTRRFDVLFDLRLNKRMSKQSRRRGFETSSHCNVTDQIYFN